MTVAAPAALNYSASQLPLHFSRAARTVRSRLRSMNLNELHSLLLILAIAALGPFISEWIPRIRMPLVILEIALGIIFGPQVLNVASAGPAIQVFATFGLAFLFFL